MLYASRGNSSSLQFASFHSPSLTMLSPECFGYLVVETGVKEAAREAFVGCFAWIWGAKKHMHDIGVQCDLIQVAPVVHCTELQLGIPISNVNLEARLAVWAARR